MKYIIITFLMLSQIALSQYKPIFVNTETDLKPFIGEWEAKQNGFTYIIFLKAQKIQRGGNHAIGKFALSGEYLIKDNINNVIIDTRNFSKLFDDDSTMGSFKIYSDFKTSYLNLNNVSNSYFIGFSDSKKCNTHITSQVTILPNDINKMIWVSEISLPSIMDEEGIKITSNKSKEKEELELYGCNRITNRSQMTIPGNLTFSRIN
ncbi:MAG: hypothetical protein ACRC8Z_11910 [Empedobacter falsenii]